MWLTCLFIAIKFIPRIPWRLTSFWMLLMDDLKRYLCVAATPEDCTNYFGWSYLCSAKICFLTLPKVFYFYFSVALIEHPPWNWNCSVNLTFNLRFTPYSRCLRSAVIYASFLKKFFFYGKTFFQVTNLGCMLIIFWTFWMLRFTMKITLLIDCLNQGGQQWNELNFQGF